jgi:quercetin dioxygenase-like cupin family protein
MTRNNDLAGETVPQRMPGFSRRGFLQGIGATALAAGLAAGPVHAETSAAPIKLPQRLSVLGAEMDLLLDANATAGRLSVLVETTPPGGGPPLHSHANEEEYFYVIAGDYEFTLAGVTLRLQPGDFVTIPRGAPHRFQNIGSAPGQLHITLSPAGFEEFFRKVAALPADAPPDFDTLRTLGQAHGLTWHGAD